ncbi:type III-B CRISPR module RAMP protein Cmr6 [candidate division KSB3 bacterium]|uniref:Type III-B CRISPR module RAMP protein Cmr6 n=1 Tax=candidate division KSB3 bacterium TaxID=2044937 RepID=A0A2G6KL04_9BACT|nr:MAG: type III-B CRISPR module RAMP protein Cmr6 [candidate division KSB3 bacterium]
MSNNDFKKKARKHGCIKRFFNDKGYGYIKVSWQKDDLKFFSDDFTPAVDPKCILEKMPVNFEVHPQKQGQVDRARYIKFSTKTSENAANKASPDLPEYLLPEDSRTTLLKAGLLRPVCQRVENFSLLLNKCAYYDRQQENFTSYRKDKIRLDHEFPQELLHDIKTRHRETLGALSLEGTDTPICAAVDWRMVLGIGNESVYESSMTLHHIYGIPYIPGQAVKGMVRNWVISEYFHACGADTPENSGQKTAEERAYADPTFRKLFGFAPEDFSLGNGRQGKIFFFDAFPTNLSSESIAVDIMNPHYGPYYSEGDKKPPADYHSPNPITFLTVKQGTQFEFYLGIRPSENYKPKHHWLGGKLSLLDLAKKSLQQALSEHGIGAKTAVGYGYFSTCRHKRSVKAKRSR